MLIGGFSLTLDSFVFSFNLNQASTLETAHTVKLPTDENFQFSGKIRGLL